MIRWTAAQAIQAMVRTRVLAAITGRIRIWTTPMMARTSHRFAFSSPPTSFQIPGGSQLGPVLDVRDILRRVHHQRDQDQGEAADHEMAVRPGRADLLASRRRALKR